MAGYPERFAQEALGHNSKAVHRAYARHAEVTVPSLEEYQKHRSEAKVIPFPAKTASPSGETLPVGNPQIPAPTEIHAGGLPDRKWSNAG
jgi:hypothetical protein